MELGTRVKLNGLAVSHGLRGTDRIGTVVGSSRDREGAWVIWDGRKSKHCYCLEYLETVPGTPGGHDGEDGADGDTGQESVA